MSKDGEHILDELSDSFRRANAECQRLRTELEEYRKIERLCAHHMRLNGVHPSSTVQAKQQQVETMAKLIKKGADFDIILNAIQANETVKEAWENLLVTMRICGLDQK